HDSSSLTVAAQLADLLGCEVSQVPGRADELFAKWKKVQKFIKKKEAVPGDLRTLSSTDEFDGDVVLEVARRLSTQPEHVVKTIQRFLSEMR
ncbi:MAG: hypothetical protein ABIH41_03205, partial [Nanoarchaeota archaeon]